MNVKCCNKKGFYVVNCFFLNQRSLTIRLGSVYKIIFCRSINSKLTSYNVFQFAHQIVAFALGFHYLMQKFVLE